MNTDTMVLFRNKLREFCKRNNIVMGMDLGPRPGEMIYTFIYTGRRGNCNKFHDSIYMVIDFAEVTCAEETFGNIIHYLVDAFELYAGDPYTYNDPNQVYITTARGNGKEFLTEQLRRNRYFEQRFELDVPKFYNSPEWIKMALNSCFGTGVYKKEKEMKPRIEKVYFNAPYTIVLWSDKTKTMVKATDEVYDPEKGLAMAICKKFLGTNASKGNYFDEFKKWLPEDHSKPVVKEVYLSATELAEKTGQSVSTVRRECAQGLHPGAEKVDGKWMIPYEGMVRR